ncbi:MAG: VanW family protein [Patescibacteria group bacterium]
MGSDRDVEQEKRSWRRVFLNPLFLSYFLGTLFLFFSLLFFAYHLAYARKIIPGVKVGEVSLGNCDFSTAVAKLEDYFSRQMRRELTFTVQGDTVSHTLSAWGVEYDVEESAQNAYLVGRDGTFLQTTREKIKAWFNGLELVPSVSINSSIFTSRLAEISVHFSEPVRDASFVLDKEELWISEGKEGWKVDEGVLGKKIVQTAETGDFSQKTLPLILLHPEVTGEDLSAVKDEVSTLVFSNPILKYDSQSWAISPEEMLHFLSFTKDSEESDVKIELDESVVDRFVSRLADALDRSPRGGTFQLKDGKVIKFSLPRSGREVDKEETRKLIARMFLDPNKNTGTIPVKDLLVEEDTNNYGIKELLAVGSSDFSGSGAWRVHNIDLASSRLDGILVAPGEVFSFNQSLGEISTQTGYKQAYIIKEGRTLLGVGGGVCQVSTTMFRAALNAGLPIEARAAHAFRVQYYEQDAGPGLDATVFSPAPDLKFRNDTPNYLLIQRQFDSKNNSLKFLIYGTPDGRRVDISDPIVHSRTPPPEPQYIEDPDLPEGTTNQVEHAVWGAKVTVNRTVTRNSEVIHQDSFFSNYQPWGAVYLVGTKE